MVVECGGAMMSRVCCLLGVYKYGGMGQSVWLSSLAIQPENGKSCFFLSFATISSFFHFFILSPLLFVCMSFIHSFLVGAN
jgi:hypothetical protein